MHVTNPFQMGHEGRAPASGGPELPPPQTRTLSGKGLDAGRKGPGCVSKPEVKKQVLTLPKDRLVEEPVVTGLPVDLVRGDSSLVAPVSPTVKGGGGASGTPVRWQETGT